jgi:H+/gluconate symporter-like permease
MGLAAMRDRHRSYQGGNLEKGNRVGNCSVLIQVNHRMIAVILFSRWVPNKEALHVRIRRKVGVRRRVLENFEGKLRNIMSCVALSTQVKIISSILTESLKESHKNLVVLLGSPVVIIDALLLISVRESYSGWRFDVKHVGNVVPRPAISIERPVGVRRKGTIFSQKSAE